MPIMYRIGDKFLEELSDDNPFKNLRSPSPSPTPLPTGFLDLPSNPPLYLQDSTICCKLNKIVKLGKSKTVNKSFLNHNEVRDSRESYETNLLENNKTKKDAHRKDLNCPCFSCNKVKNRFKIVNMKNQFA